MLGDLKYKNRSLAVQYAQKLGLETKLNEVALHDRAAPAMAEGDRRAAELARGELKRTSGARYQGQVFRARLQKMSSEAVNMDSELRGEELRREADSFIQEITTSDGRLLQSSAICSSFREHFEGLFVKEPDLKDISFQEYLADFTRLEPYEAARCEGSIWKGGIVAALGQVGANKVPRLDGLPYNIYLKMSHMLVHLLAIVFNNWFNQGNILQKIR